VASAFRRKVSGRRSPSPEGGGHKMQFDYASEDLASRMVSRG
jgi:hypothetical protein